MTAPYAIRIVGDPVLKQRCPVIENIDAALAQLSLDMIATMYDAPGVGLAAPQIGIQKRMFVYDSGDGSGPHTIINAVIQQSSGEWTYDEGCLSVPGMFFPIVRPNNVHLTGIDLDGNPVEFETSEYLGRIFQHELDHLDGILLLERLDPDQRKTAMRLLRERAFEEES